MIGGGDVGSALNPWSLTKVARGGEGSELRGQEGEGVWEGKEGQGEGRGGSRGTYIGSDGSDTSRRKWTREGEMRSARPKAHLPLREGPWLMNHMVDRAF